MLLFPPSVHSLTSLHTRHQIDALTPVNQLLFSPTQNLLVWGDTEGNLYRWVDPIPADHPGPATERIFKERKGKSLVDDESGEGKETRGYMDVEEDFGEDVDEDWIIDDLGGAAGAAVATEGSREKERGYAREIGERNAFCLCSY